MAGRYDDDEIDRVYTDTETSNREEVVFFKKVISQAVRTYGKMKCVGSGTCTIIQQGASILVVG